MQFARQGVFIFGGNRLFSSANRTKDRIEKESRVCDVVETDATSSNSVKSLVDQCVQKYGRIHILVNNLGRNEPGCPASISAETWNSQIDINLNSLYLTCHHVLPVMESRTLAAWW